MISNRYWSKSCRKLYKIASTYQLMINMIVLGVHDGHNCSAAIMKDGKIIAAVQEERFTRLKNESGFPKNSIDFCLKVCGITASQVDIWALATFEHEPHFVRTKRDAVFEVKDYLYEQKHYWDPKLSGKPVDLHNMVEDMIKTNPKLIHQMHYDFSFMKPGMSSEEYVKLFLEERKKCISRIYSVSPDRIKVMEHHICHGYYAYFGSPFRNKDVVIISLDSFGDGKNAVVRTVKNGKIETVVEMDQNDLGRFYRMITLYLGMKPADHEYKVMGLAGYAKPKYIQEIVDILEDTLQVDGLKIVHKNRPKDFYRFIQQKFEGHRFDNIAGAAQLFLENIVCKWVSNLVEHTGIRNIVISGGVSMNVKMNKRIAELECVDDIFVCPSGGDESTSIGAAYAASYNEYSSQGKNADVIIAPLENVYLGPEYSDEEIETALSNNKVVDKFKIMRNVTNDFVARKIADGRVVARFNGCMEFGARALGNRSILANPTDRDVIPIINHKIKSRDFWMPFAATLLEETSKKYIVNPKNIIAPYMTIAFDSTEEGRKKVKAGMHQADFTIRPQILSKQMNPDYYGLIKEFEKITGVGAVLNTSFNLHGHPVVCSPDDAIFTFENSDLDMLLINNTLVIRRE